MDSIVQVISKEIIKPSSQTPHHLRNHKLSVLDQILPPIYIPIILFYQPEYQLNTCTSNSTKRAQIPQRLKNSLSKILTTFYPLAGKINREASVVDCNDAGVMYVEARVHARLLDAIQHPKTEQLKRYLPVSTVEFTNNFLLAVQINFFECGGIAIGVCLWHEVADGVTIVNLVNSWAATYRTAGEAVQINPSFDLADYFPARDLTVTNIKVSLNSLVDVKKIFVAKRFVFDKEKIAALRENAAIANTNSSNDVKDPTRVELVSSFILKSFKECYKSKKLVTKAKFAASAQVVNLKKKAKDPLEEAFGNCIMITLTLFDDVTSNDETQDGTLVGFRSCIRAIDAEYIKKSQQNGRDNEHDQTFGYNYVKDLSKSLDRMQKAGLELFGFSSWCRFPVYEVDYGWGKPTWVGTTSLPLQNYTVLMDTKSGDGIEAWVNTLPDNIGSLETYFNDLLPSPTMVDTITSPQTYA